MTKLKLLKIKEKLLRSKIIKNIYTYKFSKIGTNPKRYFDNYFLNINHLEKGSVLLINELDVIHENIKILTLNSPTTLRQNIDCWIWMGFIIKIDNQLIKIVDKMSEQELIEHSKYTLLIPHTDDLVNKHRNTEIIKLLVISNKNDKQLLNHLQCSYEEILKECGRYEEIVLSDKKYIKIINAFLGDKDD